MVGKRSERKIQLAGRLTRFKPIKMCASKKTQRALTSFTLLSTHTHEKEVSYSVKVKNAPLSIPLHFERLSVF